MGNLARLATKKMVRASTVDATARSQKCSHDPLARFAAPPQRYLATRDSRARPSRPKSSHSRRVPQALELVIRAAARRENFARSLRGTRITRREHVLAPRARRCGVR